MPANSTRKNQGECHGLYRVLAIVKQNDQLIGDEFFSQPTAYSLITATVIVFIVAAIVLFVDGGYAYEDHIKSYSVPDNEAISIYI